VAFKTTSFTKCQVGTEALLVGLRHNLTKLAGEDLSLTIGMETIQLSDVVRDLGVLLDSDLSLKLHVTKIVTNYCYHAYTPMYRT